MTTQAQAAQDKANHKKRIGAGSGGKGEGKGKGKCGGKGKGGKGDGEGKGKGKGKGKDKGKGGTGSGNQFSLQASLDRDLPFGVEGMSNGTGKHKGTISF